MGFPSEFQVVEHRLRSTNMPNPCLIEAALKVCLASQGPNKFAVGVHPTHPLI